MVREEILENKTKADAETDSEASTNTEDDDFEEAMLTEEARLIETAAKEEAQVQQASKDTVVNFNSGLHGKIDAQTPTVKDILLNVLNMHSGLIAKVWNIAISLYIYSHC